MSTTCVVFAEGDGRRGGCLDGACAGAVVPMGAAYAAAEARLALASEAVCREGATAGALATSEAERPSIAGSRRGEAPGRARPSRLLGRLLQILS